MLLPAEGVKSLLESYFKDTLNRNFAVNNIKHIFLNFTICNLECALNSKFGLLFFMRIGANNDRLLLPL